MKQRSVRFIALLLMALPLPACAQTANSANVTSLCELPANAEKVRGKVVRFSAIYETDLRDLEVVRDEKCPGIVMSLNFDAADRDVSVNQFSAEITGDGAADTRRRRFKIDVSGIFEPDDGKAVQSILMPVRKSGRIIAKKVWSFTRF